MKYSRRLSVNTASASPVENLESRLLLATFTVTNVNDSGTGSLRWAIDQSNNTAGVDTIAFNLPAGGRTIQPTSELPAIWDAAAVDGSTQPGYAGQPLVRIDGGKAGNAVGLRLYGSDTVKGLCITGFSGDGINMPATRGGYSGNTVQGNWIGIDLTGNAAAGNNAQGIGIYTAGNLVGGANAGDRNVVSGSKSAQGIFIYGSGATNNTVQNNYVGTNASGGAALANAHNGVDIQDAPGNKVIGNLISGNTDDGVIISGTNATGNTITGNTIGLDASGSNLLPNRLYGIEIQSANNTVGGSTAAARNIVSGNLQAGVVLYTASATGNLIQGNYIGTDITGTLDRGNSYQGVAISGANSNTLRDNLVSGNDAEGVGIFPGNNNIVRGNSIGLTAGGAHLPNGTWAITLYNGASGNIIGGSSAGEPNLISALHPSGTITPSSSNSILSNTIVQRDGTPPRVTSAQFVYAVSPQKLVYVFSEDVSASLSTADISVVNTGTGATYAPASLVYDKSANTATFTFGSSLPNAVFRAQLIASGITDASGNPLDGNGDGTGGDNYTFNFFYLKGDANRDGVVDFTDLVRVSQNYRKTNATWEMGDFNGDGVVNFADMVIVSQNYKIRLTIPAGTNAFTSFRTISPLLKS